MIDSARQLAARLPDPVRSRLRGAVRGAPSRTREPSHHSEGTDAAPTPSDDRMTAADIEAAYRLFHGRAPDPEGLAFFSAHVGEWSVREMLPYFAHSDEFRSSDTYRVLLGGVHGDGVTAVDFDGVHMLIPDGDGAIGDVLHRTGTYEPHVLAALDAATTDGGVVVDCGANIGIIAMRAARRVGPTGRVIAIEALTSNASLLRVTAALNRFSHVDVRHAAVGNQPGTFVVDPGAGSNGIVSGRLDELLDTTSPEVLLARTVVPVLLLDDLATELDRLDVLKIDVEGAEGLAVSGGMRLLEQHRPTVLMEYSPDLIGRVSGIDGADLLVRFHDLGYRIDVLDPEMAANGTDPATPDELLSGSGRDHLDLRLVPERT